MKVLLIGSTKGRILTLLKSVNDVRSFVESYSPRLNPDAFIGDLSVLSAGATSVLLKFIEEGVRDITCYASADNVNPVLMSRFDVIEKHDKVVVGEDGFMAFLNEMKDRQQDGDKVVNLEKEFVASSASHLNKFLLFKGLDSKIIDRVGDNLF